MRDVEQERDQPDQCEDGAEPQVYSRVRRGRQLLALFPPVQGETRSGRDTPDRRNMRHQETIGRVVSLVAIGLRRSAIGPHEEGNPKSDR